MAKVRTRFVCQNCGAVYPRWAGKCDECGEWNTIVEDDPLGGIQGGPSRPTAKGRAVALASLDGEIDEAPRVPTSIGELDRVLGGGFVRGSAVLIGGDPGIGKSTLLMQAAASMAKAGRRVVYVSGEEAVAQVRLRAQRLGVQGAPVQLMAETCIENIETTLKEEKRPDLIIVDSIQTLWTQAVESAPGTVTQLRATAQAMTRLAKSTGSAVVLVGHVTKDGAIAGPRVVEHMVDAVIYFEGEGGHPYRILRSVKNRFGATNEIGVFDMRGDGLAEVTNPSELFLGERNAKAPGAAVFAGMEGTRPILVEIQALVTPSTLGTARRAVVGWGAQRLSMILAVLESHCGVRLAQHDVYLNVAGGYKILEPGADLAVAAALTSSLAQAPLPTDAVYFGEVSLSGSVRPVAYAGPRLKEAVKLGFNRAVIPAGSNDLPGGKRDWREVNGLPDLVATIAASGAAPMRGDDAEG